MNDLFKQAGIELSPEQEKKLNIYYKLLVEWNNKINLTAITEYNEVILKHFIDSLLFIKAIDIDIEKEYSFIDVGTGAGFPGLVLAIFLPNSKFTLMDSLNKRIDFLNLVIEELELSNVNTIHSRAEDLGKNDDFREKYDFVVSRAVAELPILMEYCTPFCKIDGMFVSYKGKKYEEEIKNSEHAFSELGCEMFHVKHLNLTEDIERMFLLIKKVDNTPSKYPRRSGIPKKKPL